MAGFGHSRPNCSGNRGALFNVDRMAMWPRADGLCPHPGTMPSTGCIIDGSDEGPAEEWYSKILGYW